jgi:hypothetical protein
MDAVSAIGDPRPRGAGAVISNRADGGGHAIRVERQTKIIVGSDQNRGTPVDARLGAGQHLVEADAERVRTRLQHLVVPARDQSVLVEEIH